jgi:hypothetical protein
LPSCGGQRDRRCCIVFVAFFVDDVVAVAIERSDASTSS